MAKVTSKNPTTDEDLQEYELHSSEQIEGILLQSQHAFLHWRQQSFSHRGRLMAEAASTLLGNKREYAEMMTLEMGKTIASAEAEVEKCAWVCNYYAEHAAEFLQDQQKVTDAQESFVTYQPLGAVLAVMPWNYPFWQVFRFAAPTLMAGNVGLLKHASNVPGCALLIEDVFRKSGFPNGVFSTLLVNSETIQGIIEHKVVRAVTLTGSGPAGSAVAALAGKMIKPSLLELGGSDPYIILEDADIELAARKCCDSRLLNAGQSCIGAKRFLVVDEIYDSFMEAFVEKMKKAMMGDPFTAVDLGPMARKDLRKEVHEQVTKSLAMGADLVLGGQMPVGPGAFYPPTILANVASGMPAYHEEIFGPVASVIRVTGEKEAIKVANATEFGLGAAVFTHDLARGRRIAREELQAGCCFVNDFVKSDPRLPFGGIKTSGYGRELSSEGIRAFVNTKTVYVG